MKQFDIALHSFEDVQEFVQIATVQPFRVLVGSNQVLVNAKSFMGMFSVDYTRPVHVRADCTDEENRRFQAAVARFLAN